MEYEHERRVRRGLGIVKDTDQEAKPIPGLIRKLVEGVEKLQRKMSNRTGFKPSELAVLMVLAEAVSDLDERLKVIEEPEPIPKRKKKKEPVNV